MVSILHLRGLGGGMRSTECRSSHHQMCCRDDRDYILQCNVRERRVDYRVVLSSVAETMRASTDDATAVYSVSAAVMNVTSSTSGGDDPVTATSHHAYVLLTTVTSILSMLGCAMLVVADAAFRDLRSHGRRLLTWLSVADCLTAVGNLTGVAW